MKEKKFTKNEVIDLINEISVPESPPTPNSEYHNGFEAARVHYAEAKLKVLRKL